jgi:hypothetical protein
MPTRNASEKWESLRPSDGSPLVIRFDWYANHSGWRLEELSESIDKAVSLLATYGVHPDRPEHIHELPRIASQLRVLHRDHAVPDDEVRKALALADDLDLGDDIESLDSQFEYENTIEHLEDVLDAWDDYNSWRWTQEVWYVHARRLLEELRKSRNGLGDRWSVTVTDRWVELPDGTVVNGHVPSPPVESLLDLAYHHIGREDDLAEIAPALVDFDEKAVPRASALLEAICAVNDDLDARTVQTVLRTASDADLSEKRLQDITAMVTALAGEWHQHFDELVVTATTLTDVIA